MSAPTHAKPGAREQGCISRLSLQACDVLSEAAGCTALLKLDSEHGRPADHDFSCLGASSCVAAALAYSLAFARASFAWRLGFDKHTAHTARQAQSCDSYGSSALLPAWLLVTMTGRCKDANTLAVKAAASADIPRIYPELTCRKSPQTIGCDCDSAL